MIKLLVTIAAVTGSSCLYSGLIVVEEYQGAVSAHPYYVEINKAIDVKGSGIGSSEAENRALLTSPTEIPFKPTSLTISEPIVKTIKNLYRPIALIGTDRTSMEWLVEATPYLQDKNATIFLIEVSLQSDWVQIQKYARDNALSIEIMSGDALSEIYGISTYPVLLQGESL